MLAPSKVHTFWSYVTGWLTVCGWQGNTAVTAYSSSRQILGMVTLSMPNYQYQPWHQVLTAMAVVSFSIMINTRGGFVLPRFEASMLCLHILGFFAVLIPLAVISPKMSAQDVFEKFLNNGSEPTYGISWMIGTLGTLLVFVSPFFLSSQFGRGW